MVFAYLAIGTLLVLALHGFLRWREGASPEDVRRVNRWLLIILCVGLALLLLRIGRPLLGLAAVAFPFVMRGMGALMTIHAFRRMMGEMRRGKTSGGGGLRARGGMSADEAREILGIGPDATEEEIRHAHRELIRRIHPDHGGTPYLARQINEARDVLLRGRKKG